ncbi:hypothetical protein ABEB36_013046 [Hypothenemus hampei]|uniref:Uncharacterized protein n=1 Tax=Hypothenemus hampei TaxID=57062 RepID=A0ABD1E6M6_HYPHA
MLFYSDRDKRESPFEIIKDGEEEEEEEYEEKKLNKSTITPFCQLSKPVCINIIIVRESREYGSIVVNNLVGTIDQSMSDGLLQSKPADSNTNNASESKSGSLVHFSLLEELPAPGSPATHPTDDSSGFWAVGRSVVHHYHRIPSQYGYRFARITLTTYSIIITAFMTHKVYGNLYGRIVGCLTRTKSSQ